VGTWTYIIAHTSPFSSPTSPRCTRLGSAWLRLHSSGREAQAAASCTAASSRAVTDSSQCRCSEAAEAEAEAPRRRRGGMSLYRRRSGRRLRQPALPSIGIGDMPPGVLAKILLGVATEFVPTCAAASYAQVCRPALDRAGGVGAGG
jgi:hypothetical protein